MPAHTWDHHMQQGEAFSSENFLIAAVGLLNHVQLFNPAGSGVRVRLRSAHAIATTPPFANVRRHDVALAIVGPPAPFIIENLLGGGAAAVAEMRGAQLAAAVGSIFWQVNALTLSPATYPPEGREWGFDLLPGQGILFQAGANITLIINWMWVEVPL